MALTLTLPLPPNVANARMHWAQKNRLRCNYELLTFARVRLARGNAVSMGNPRPMFERVRVDATFYVWSLMDADNLTARLKFPLDALRKAEIIANDDPAHLTLGTVTQVVDRKHQRLELRLEEA